MVRGGGARGLITIRIANADRLAAGIARIILRSTRAIRYRDSSGLSQHFGP